MTNFGKTALLISGLCLLVSVSVGCSEQKVTELKAEEQGDAEAQPDSGAMYDEGDAVARGGAAAVKRLRKAAEQGDARAQNSLGIAFAEGRGVPQDNVRAHMWFNLGNMYRDRDRVAQQLTPDQLAEAQHLARAWDAAHPREP